LWAGLDFFEWVVDMNATCFIQFCLFWKILCLCSCKDASNGVFKVPMIFSFPGLLAWLIWLF
jgi:hypothetical protein